MVQVNRDTKQRPKHGSSRPGGRTAAVREAVVSSVLELLAEGKVGLPVAELAQRAGVNRSTIHRRWPSRLELVRDALSVHTNQLAVPDTGRWPQDAELLVKEMLDFCVDPVEIGLNAAMASGADPELNQWVIDHWARRANDLAEPVRKAILRGELRTDTDPVALIHLMLGPIVMWSVLIRQNPPKTLVDNLLKQVLQIGSKA